MGHGQKAQAEQEPQEFSVFPGAPFPRFPPPPLFQRPAGHPPDHPQGQHPQGHQGIGQQQGQESPQVHLIMEVQVQVLGIPHRGDHAPQVGGQGLEDDDPGCLFFRCLPCQAEEGKGDEGDQGHVVGDPHAAEKAGKHQHRPQLPGSGQPFQEMVQEPVKEACFPQAPDHPHEAEQKGQHRQVESPHQGPGRGHRPKGQQGPQGG